MQTFIVLKRSLVFSVVMMMFAWPNTSLGAQTETVQLQMIVGETVFLSANKATRIAIGNPAIADALVFTSAAETVKVASPASSGATDLPGTANEIMVNAKSEGFTTLTVWDKNGQRSYRIFVSRVSAAMTHSVYRLKNYSLVRPVYDSSAMTIKSETDKDSVASLIALLTPLLGPENVTVDAYNNLAGISGTDAALNSARELLDSIDQPVAQIMIEARVMELTDEDMKQMGMSFAAERRRVSTGSDLTGANNESSITFDTFADLAKHFQITLDNINEMIIGNTLTHPRIQTRDGGTAEILVGQKYPVAELQTSSDQFDRITYHYINTGISLAIRPHVGENGMVDLWIRPEVSAITGWVGDPNNAGNAAPIIDTREAMTQVNIKDGESVFIGGLKRTYDLMTKSKVPLLGDVPVLGKLFRKKRMESTTTELVIVITPHILASGDNTYGAEEVDKVEMYNRIVPPKPVDARPENPSIFKQWFGTDESSSRKVDEEPATK